MDFKRKVVNHMKDQRVYNINGNNVFIGIIGTGKNIIKSYKFTHKKIPKCPICNKEISNGTVYCCLSNYLVLPNIMLHEECVNIPNIEEKLYELYLEYNDYKEKKDKWE